MCSVPWGSTVATGAGYRSVGADEEAAVRRLAATLIVGAGALGLGLVGVGIASAARPATAPTITGQPGDVTVALGKTAHFTVRATGSPKPTYQWQVSDDGGTYVDVGGATRDNLSVATTLSDDGDSYHVVVTNRAGSITSAPATLDLGPFTSPAGVKPLVPGLFDKGSEAPYQTSSPFPVTPTAELDGYGTAFSGIVVNVTWAQLEPVEGTFDFSDLDASLAAVAAYNEANPANPLVVKLRVWGGFTAPDWAKALDGPPIEVPPFTDHPDPATIGEYWAADYEQQWTDLQSALAQRYDDDRLLDQVAVTSCNTATGEPFVSNRTIETALVAAGWTGADQQQCLESALSGYAAWIHTPVDYTVNGFTYVSSTGVDSQDFPVTEAVMEQCAASDTSGTAPLCVLDNHGLTDTVTTQQAPVYREIDALWQQYDHRVPVDFQTVAPGGFDLCSAIGVAVAEHAESVEVWPPGAGSSGFQAYTPAQLTAWDLALARGRRPACS